MKYFVLFAFLTLFSSTSLVFATNPSDIIISEIAWMGTKVNYNDEWLELQNVTNSSISLEGWVLKAVDETPEINLTGVIPANGFYLLERTDDNTLPQVIADQIYVGALKNDGEVLILYDNFENLIDSVNCEDGWFAGDNTTKQTMERINPTSSTSAYENWQTSQNPGGTPKSQNSAGQPQKPECEPTKEVCDGIDNDCDDLIDENLGETTCGIGACQITIVDCIDGTSQACIPETPTEEICDQIDNNCNGEIDENGICEIPDPILAPETKPETEPIIYPLNVFINEFLPNPLGPDSENEWIEIYNNNPINIDLSGWTIEDTQGSTKIHTFPEGSIAEKYQFLVLTRPVSKIVLNNDGEGLILKNPLGILVNSIDCSDKSFEGESFAKKSDGTWKWTSIITPGTENIFPAKKETEFEQIPEQETEPNSETEENSTSTQKEETTPEAGTTTELETQPESKPEPEPIIYPLNVFINEILPSPQGPDAENEWIEILNQNIFEVDLTKWEIADTIGKTKNYIFPKGSIIDPGEFLILPRPKTKITLNNSGDGLILKHPDGKIVHEVVYEKAPIGQSYNLTITGWAWSTILTPEKQNEIPSAKSVEIDEPLVSENIEKNTKTKQGLASIGEPISDKVSPAISLIALVLAVFSGAVIFLLKRKVKIS